MTSNIQDVNANNLGKIAEMAKLVLDNLVASDVTDAFIKPTNFEELRSHSEQTNVIIVAKIRKKLKV